MLDLHGYSRESFDLIVGEEVTSQSVYNRRYRHPEWPKFQSGVTGGIGFDFGQATRAEVTAAWKGKIPDAMLKALLKCCGITGQAAEPLAQSLRGVVDIPWETALDVFSNHDVPRYGAMLRAACPGVEQLAPHCQGALLSTTFNRGASFSKPGARYAEMREIKACIKSGNLARIPALLRSMQRLWPKTSALYRRREHEAVLFEKGLAEHHPEHFADLENVAPVVDPELVERVQQQLRQVGYYQVGAIDGSLTPRGKTEDAILAFRNRNGLPLTPGIDDDFLTALAKAQPPEISDERAGATVEDLRAQKSETIAFTDQVKGWAGKLFGTSGGLGGAGLLAALTERATAVGQAKDAVAGLGITPHLMVIIAAIAAVLLVSAGLSLLVWHVAHRVEQKRLVDYRIGKNP